MKKFEYSVLEKKFEPKGALVLETWLSMVGLNGWDLVFMIPLQVFDDRNVLRPGTVNMTLSFLCVFKRKRSRFKDWLFMRKYTLKNFTNETHKI